MRNVEIEVAFVKDDDEHCKCVEGKSALPAAADGGKNQVYRYFRNHQKDVCADFALINENIAEKIECYAEDVEDSHDRYMQCKKNYEKGSVHKGKRRVEEKRYLAEFRFSINGSHGFHLDYEMRGKVSPAETLSTYLIVSPEIVICKIFL